MLKNLEKKYHYILTLHELSKRKPQTDERMLKVEHMHMYTPRGANSPRHKASLRTSEHYRKRSKLPYLLLWKPSPYIFLLWNSQRTRGYSRGKAERGHFLFLAAFGWRLRARRKQRAFPFHLDLSKFTQNTAFQGSLSPSCLFSEALARPVISPQRK